MKKEQRICVLLAIMILGIWGVEAKNSGSLIPKSWKIRMIQSVQENAERLYMPGVTYTEKKQGEIRVTEAVVHMASALIPLGNYVTEREAAELLTEDEATYAILAKKQAEEENSVDENGQLIGKDKSEETRQASVPTMDLSMERLNDFEYLVSNFYTVDSVTYINPSELNASELLGKDLRIDLSTGGSKILIYHTHSQETFADSDNDPSTSIVGIGRYLTEILNNKYKIPTMHHEGVYDLINGKLDRSEAYEFAKPEVEQILAENPSIEVVIDLHRDGVADTTHLVTEINGKPTAQIMFFNGLSRTRVNGDLAGCLLSTHRRSGCSICSPKVQMWKRSSRWSSVCRMCAMKLKPSREIFAIMTRRSDIPPSICPSGR